MWGSDKDLLKQKQKQKRLYIYIRQLDRQHKQIQTQTKKHPEINRNITEAHDNNG